MFAHERGCRRSRFRLFVVPLVFFLMGSAPDPHSAVYHHYAVAADHLAASEAGAEVLHNGGNAADAAAATMLALGVVNPASSGIGGGGFALYFRAKDRSLTFLDFRERAPAAATRTMYSAQEPSRDGPASAPSQLGGLASGVPGEPAGIEALVRRFGRLELDQVVAPALALARQGVPVDESFVSMAAAFSTQLRKDPTMHSWPDLKAGELLVRPALARVLQAFSEGGAAAIYHGEIAGELVVGVRVNGGIFTRQDLLDYRVVDRAPLFGEYFGYEWVTAPPPSAGGFTLLQSLAILARIPEEERREEVDRLHALVESWKGPFLDRRRYFGDPDQVILPLEAMMAPARLDRRAELFDPAQATSTDRYELPVERPGPSIVQPENSGTSHLCVVDAEGNVAAVTTTVNLPFGARYVAGGIVMNDEMDDFARAEGAVNAFGLVGGGRNLPGPRKRPVSTMSPTIVFENGEPVLCVGASGGSRIVTATEQVAMNILLAGMTAAAAIKAPRIHHQGFPDVLRVEEVSPLDEATKEALRARGHTMATIGNVATVQAIHIRRQGGGRILEAASDPRKGGAPAGK